MAQENKINIAELLKDCLKGMELDCTMYDNVEFDYVEQSPESTYPIHCLIKINGGYNALVFTHNGCNDRHPNAKCVIFPKGKTTWEGFHRPFKDGEVVVCDNPHREYLQIFIFKNKIENNALSTCYLMLDGDELVLEEDAWYVTRIATEEEKQKLFDAIKANGYKWNAETKTLEKLIKPKFKVGDTISYEGIVATITDMGEEFYTYTNGCIDFKYQDNWVLVKDNIKPKFKVGDRIKQKGSPRSYVIIYIEHDRYRLHNNQFVKFVDEKIYELVPDKFDITTLKPFDKVLVRDGDNETWVNAFFGFRDTVTYKACTFVTGNENWCQCVPYEGNEHLLGTTDDCDDFYKNW